MATNVIMPALEMAQESGVLVRWLKREGEAVAKGEPLMEIETDKVTVEIEAPASGLLGGLRAQEGEAIPVGRTVAWILAPGESVPAGPPPDLPTARAASVPPKHDRPAPAPAAAASREASPVAKQVAAQHGVDLSSINPAGRRIEKADVMAFIAGPQRVVAPGAPTATVADAPAERVAASPKARRLALERGLALKNVPATGPGGAVLAADVLLAAAALPPRTTDSSSTVWRLMAEHMTSSWTSVPHFFLTREVDAARLKQWRRHIAPTVEKQAGVRPTFTDLFVKLIGVALREHPRLNAAWVDGGIQWNDDINVGIATALESGLVVPVIAHADRASLSAIAARRHDLVERAQSRKLHPADVSGGTFTLSNLGMYNVDSFSAIVNTPQAAILALGRIAERVVPLNGQAVIRPRLVMTLSCDHRVVDGARAAQFLEDLANLIEDPWRLLS